MFDAGVVGALSAFGALGALMAKGVPPAWDTFALAFFLAGAPAALAHIARKRGLGVR